MGKKDCGLAQSLSIAGRGLSHDRIPSSRTCLSNYHEDATNMLNDSRLQKASRREPLALDTSPASCRLAGCHSLLAAKRAFRRPAGAEQATVSARYTSNIFKSLCLVFFRSAF
jgi:hypothetical protein